MQNVYKYFLIIIFIISFDNLFRCIIYQLGCNFVITPFIITYNLYNKLFALLTDSVYPFKFHVIIFLIYLLKIWDYRRIKYQATQISVLVLNLRNRLRQKYFKNKFNRTIQ